MMREENKLSTMELMIRTTKGGGERGGYGRGGKK